MTELGRAARWVVFGWAVVGCEARHPDFRAAPDVVGVVAPDAGDATTTADAPDVPTADAPDAGTVAFDVGTEDVVGVADAPDVGASDTVDVAPSDTGFVDAGADVPPAIDAGAPDAGAPDVVGASDAGTSDAGAPDVAGTSDAGTPDVGPTDAGTVVVGSPTESCALTGAPAVSGFGRFVLAANTSSRNNDHRPSCADENAADVGYLVTLTSTSRLSWTARAAGGGTLFAPTVYLTQDCTLQGMGDTRFLNEVACVEGGLTTAPRTGTVDLPAGSYYLVVDSTRSGFGGAYEVTLDVSPAAPSPDYSQELLTTLRCSTVPSGTQSLRDVDDAVSSVQNLGFSFAYFGRTFDRLVFYSNGFLTLVADGGSPWNDASWRNHALPFSGLPRGVVAPFWDDLYVENRNGNGVYFWTDGTAPNRVAHVAWRNVGFYRSRLTQVSFEARLFQTTNVIELVYCSESASNPYSRGAEATVGLESFDQTAGRLVSLNRTGAVAPNTGYRFTPR